MRRHRRPRSVASGAELVHPWGEVTPPAAGFTSFLYSVKRNPTFTQEHGVTSETQQPPTSTPSALADGAIHGQEALRTGAAALLRYARRDARLAAPYLDPAIFNTGSVADALSEFVTRHPRNRVRILVEDINQVLRDNGRLVSLVRRLADSIELREVEENERGARDLYFVADRAVCLFQEAADGMDGVVSHVPREIATRLERFEAAWHRAQPVALRTLGL